MFPMFYWVPLFFLPSFIGLVAGKIYRKPWFLPLNTGFFRFQFSLKPIHRTLDVPTISPPFTHHFTTMFFPPFHQSIDHNVIPFITDIATYPQSNDQLFFPRWVSLDFLQKTHHFTTFPLRDSSPPGCSATAEAMAPAARSRRSNSYRGPADGAISGIISVSKNSIVMVGGFSPPLWKIWVRQLGWLDIPNISGKIKKWQPNHQPEIV